MLETLEMPNSRLGIPDWDLVPGRLSHLNLLRDPLAWRFQNVNLPLSAQGSGPWEVVTP